MKIRESHLGTWSSSRAFAWVATGAALGIGNLVRLPVLMTEHGGSLFLLAYLAALALVSVPLLLAEWMLGRWTRADVGAGFSQLASDAGAGWPWRQMGVLSLLGAVMLLSFYSVIAGWSLGYMFRAASGDLAGVGARSREVFLDLARDPERSLAWHTLFMVLACMVVSQGVRDGIERAAGYLVPASFGCLALLVGLGAWRGDTAPALRALFAPDASRFGWHGVVEALQHAFFTLGLGFGVMATLGTCLSAQAPLVRTAIWVVALDTLFSLMAGVVVLPLVLAAGVAPANGLTLVFETFPRALPFGWTGIAFGTLFYFAIFMATLASAVALLEPLTRFLMERFRYTRVFAATTGAVIVWYLGLGSLLSFGYFADLELLGRNFFEWMQWLSATVIAPVSGLMMAALAAQLLPRELSRAAWGHRNGWLYPPWRAVLTYPARIGLIVILLSTLGALDWLATLWI